MGLIKSPLGVITQTVGSLTFSTWKGKNVVKSKVPDNNMSRSNSQVRQRNEFSVLAKLSGQLGAAVRVGFRMFANGMTEQNVFMTRNKAALTLDPNTQAVSGFNNLIISAGKIDGAASLGYTYDLPNHVVALSWDSSQLGTYGAPGDVCFAAVVNTKTLEGYVSTSFGNRRDDGITVDVPTITAANKADYVAYVFFKSALSNDCSNTQFIDLV